MDDLDTFFMRRALAEAERGRGAVEPNPMVGAVVVRDGRVVGVGHHARFGGPHAEVVALGRPATRPAGRRSTSRSNRAATTARPRPAPTPSSPPGSPGSSPRCATRSPRSPAAGSPGSARRASRSRSGSSRPRPGGSTPRTSSGWRPAGPYVTAKWAMTLDGKTRRGLGRQPMDLRPAVAGPRPRAPRPDGRDRRRDRHRPGRRPAARPPGPPAPGSPPGSSSTASARLPADGRLARTAREVPVLVAVTDRAPADRRRGPRSPRLRDPRASRATGRSRSARCSTSSAGVG